MVGGGMMVAGGRGTGEPGGGGGQWRGTSMYLFVIGVIVGVQNVQQAGCARKYE